MTRVNDARDLGALIAEERKRQHMTQGELAGLSGVGITFISKLENGKSTSELGKVLDVVATLGLNVYVEERD